MLDTHQDSPAIIVEGSTWAHEAVACSRGDVVRALFLAGADVNKTGKYGQTPLMKAAANDDGSVVQDLLHAQVTIEARDSQGRSALFYAVCHGYEEDAESWPLEHHALITLLKAGAKVDARDMKGSTPLLHCLDWLASTDDKIGGPLDVLLHYNPDLTLRTSAGLSTLDFVLKINNFVKPYQLALACIQKGLFIKPKSPSRVETLTSAARHGDVAYVKYLTWRSLIKGERDFEMPEFREALFAGVTASSTPIVTFLMVHMAAVDEVQSFTSIDLDWILEHWAKDGRTILHAAIKANMTELASMLREHLEATTWSQLLEVKDNEGRTAIQMMRHAFKPQGRYCWIGNPDGPNGYTVGHGVTFSSTQ